MSNSVTARLKIRKNFERVSSPVKMPYLIELQKSSYEKFLQKNIHPDSRSDEGLQAAFKSVFPIKDFVERSQLDFLRYNFGASKYDVEECMQRGLTFSAPLRVFFNLTTWDTNDSTGIRTVSDVKEQEVYVGDMPLMTENGTFVINGVERVVVSQMHRSPGVFFDHDRGKTHSSGKILFSARVIPYRGSWLDFEFDSKDILNVRIDRRRKLPVTTLLMALDSKDISEKGSPDFEDLKKYSHDIDVKVTGMSRQEILNEFYNSIHYNIHKDGWSVEFGLGNIPNDKLIIDMVDADTGEVVVEAGKKLSNTKAKILIDKGLRRVLLPKEDLIGKFLSEDCFSDNGDMIAKSGDEITSEILDNILSIDSPKVKILAIDYVKVGPHLLNTLATDRNLNREDALLDIYRVLRPGEPPTLESAVLLFKSLFFDPERFDLSSVGRVKINSRLSMDVEDSIRVLRRDDIIEIIRTLLSLKDGHGEVDDIDNLANRRVRSVGELLENSYRVGLLRMERAVRERMGSVDIESTMPNDLINAKPAAAAVKEFFGSSQLSQFMDQTNPLSEITHKRRLSALGPGGLTRDRAGFEVRDVHPTHYGRICPIETPEGQNIGLINSLATYARINKYGFIETPYRQVISSKVTDKVIYLSAMEEWRYNVAQATSKLTSLGCFADEFVVARCSGEVMMVLAQDVDYMDVSPKQLVSVAASLIPFLENDDANRALMGSNMQRQAVPLLINEAPLVGTGMERIVARDSGVVLLARRPGIVDQVDGTRIVIRVHGEENGEGSGVDIYKLRKFQRSNQSTCLNQRPLVRAGDVIQIGDPLADGPSTDDAELALGRNALVAFLSWNGYNFEDSIIVSERIVKEDIYTSVHIEEFEIAARDTKLGNEELTRDIPNVNEDSLRNLDEVGIVAIGSEVKKGDILVGKVTPKGETPSTAEEKLLRAIFGEKAADVRDSSLRVPPGAVGTVVDVRVFSRRGVDKDERALAIEQVEINRLAKDRDDEGKILENAFCSQIRNLLKDQEVLSDNKKTSFILREDFINTLSLRELCLVNIIDKNIDKVLRATCRQLETSLAKLQSKFEDRVSKLQVGDELMPGVLKMVKVFIAVKRKLKPGDKMAGRHGNKGVVSYIAPIEDMPYLEDGTPVDIILNPLGIPSRMNVGQILETHLGWASAGMGSQVSEILKRYSKDNNADNLRNYLSSLLDDKKDYLLGCMDEDDLVEVSAKLVKGVPLATPIFDGANERDVEDSLRKAGLHISGQVTLYDGCTGMAFPKNVTVGYMYILKLHHLVDEKLHARSIGPYSLVTQQPLGGKAQFGGQRFGEMEVWALEAYGASYSLQEMLTVKSDDIVGRTKVYESIVRGDDNFEAGIPESFNVLVKELRALGLNMEMGQQEALEDLKDDFI